MRSCNCESAPETIGDRTGRSEESGANVYRKVLKQFLNLIGWIVPSAILALIPKCPLCLAGYAVIGTSVGFSLSALSQLRLVLIILCIAVLCFLSARYIVHSFIRATAKARS